MASKKKKRIIIGLRCVETKKINYFTAKNPQNTTEKIKVMRYCPILRKHTLHEEVKIK